MRALGKPAKDLIPEGKAMVEKLQKNQKIRKKWTQTHPLDPSTVRFIWLVAEKNLPPPVAWIEAGKNKASISQATVLMKSPRVAAAIAESRAKIEKASQITRRRVVDGFLEAVDFAKMAGEPIAMVAAWREIGRMCGFYEPIKHQIDLTVNGQVMLEKLEAVPRDKLLAIAEGGDTIDGEFTVPGENNAGEDSGGSPEPGPGPAGPGPEAGDPGAGSPGAL